MTPPIPRLTKPQLAFIEGLAIDCSLNRFQLIQYINNRIEKPVRYVDDLNKVEASQIIGALIETKKGIPKSEPRHAKPVHPLIDYEEEEEKIKYSEFEEEGETW
jgi:hypothetical protein